VPALRLDGFTAEHMAHLEWDYDGDVDAFRIWPWSRSAGAWGEPVEFPKHRRHGEVWGLTSGSYYDFAIAAVRGEAMSPFTYLYGVATYPNVTQEPENVRVKSVGRTEIEVTWNYNLVTSSGGFIVYYRELEGDGQWNWGADALTGLARSALVKGLTPATAYEFSVYAWTWILGRTYYSDPNTPVQATTSP